MKNISQHLLIGCVVLLTAASCSSRKGRITSPKLTFQQKSQFDELYFKASTEKILGNHIEAARLFGDALKIDAKSHATMYQLANLNMAVSGFHDAVYWAEKSMIENPEYNYWYAGQLAQAYSKVGEFTKSAQIFEVMIKEEPGNHRNYQEASRQYINAEEFKKAIKVLEDYVTLFGIDEEAARLLEGLCVKTGKPKEAIVWMKKLSDSDLDNLRYKGLLAESYVGNGQIDEAKLVYHNILAAEPNNGYAHFGLADIYKRLKQEDSSFYYLGKGFDDVNIPIETKIKVIGSFFPYLRTEPKMRDKAVELTQKLIEIHSKDDKAFLVRSDVLHAIGDVNEARSLVVTASELNPGNISIWKKLLGLDDELDNNEWLLKDSKEALSFFPNQPFLYIINAFANYMGHFYEEAISSGEQGLELALLQKDKVDLLVTVADASYELGLYDKCYDTYDEVLELDDDNDGALNNYAYYLSEQKVRLNDALVMIDKALEINPNRPTYLDTKGWVLFQLGRYEEALPVLKKAYSHFKADKEVGDHYAQCLEKLGKADEAKKIRETFNQVN